MGHCCDRTPGISGRCALYSSYSLWRKVFSGPSHATITLSGRYSLTTLSSIWLSPYRAFVGKPFWVLMLSGRAK